MLFTETQSLTQTRERVTTLETRYLVSRLNPAEVPVSEFQDLSAVIGRSRAAFICKKTDILRIEKHVLRHTCLGQTWMVLTRLFRNCERTLREVCEKYFTDQVSPQKYSDSSVELDDRPSLRLKNRSDVTKIIRYSVLDAQNQSLYFNQILRYCTLLPWP